MTDIERVKAVLEKKYGIKSYEELVKAIDEFPGFDIGIFCKKVAEDSNSEEGCVA